MFCLCGLFCFVERVTIVNESVLFTSMHQDVPFIRFVLMVFFIGFCFIYLSIRVFWNIHKFCKSSDWELFFSSSADQCDHLILWIFCSFWVFCFFLNNCELCKTYFESHTCWTSLESVTLYRLRLAGLLFGESVESVSLVIQIHSAELEISGFFSFLDIDIQACFKITQK